VVEGWAINEPIADDGKEAVREMRRDVAAEDAAQRCKRIS